MGFFKQEYWSRLPFSSPGDLPDPGIEPSSLKSPALAGGFVTTSATWEAPCSTKVKKPLECSSLIIVVTCDKVSSEDCLPISYSVVLMKDDFPFCRFLLSLAVAYLLSILSLHYLETLTVLTSEDCLKAGITNVTPENKRVI